MNGSFVHGLQDFIRGEQNGGVTVGRIDEPEDSFRNGIDIVITLVIRRGHIFRNVHPGMVLIVKGESRALAHKVFGEPGNPVFSFLKNEKSLPSLMVPEVRHS